MLHHDQTLIEEVGEQDQSESFVQLLDLVVNKSVVVVRNVVPAKLRVMISRSVAFSLETAYKGVTDSDLKNWTF